MNTVFAPFTEAQVKSLNDFQKDGFMHPFTCGNDNCRHVFRDRLVATPSGWKCEHCEYTQGWAHGFMADDSWRKPAKLLHDYFSGVE